MSDIKKITLPLTDDVVTSLCVGDSVEISGELYTARDAAHKRLHELLVQGLPLPLSLDHQTIYYVGPTPAKPGHVIGSAGPTTSTRMDAYTPLLLEKTGLKGMIGKGSRSQGVKDACQKHEAVYFAAVGGAGALLAQCIVKEEIVAYGDLGTEAIRKLTVRNFPAVVAIDTKGNDLFEQEKTKYQTILSL